MITAIAHPLIPPVKRETVKYDIDPYKHRFYHTSTVVLNTIKEAPRSGIPKSTATALGDASIQIQERRDLVEMHFDQRISLFFIHLITCWNTPYEFHIGEANEQLGGGTNSVKIEGGGTASCRTRAAHSSTLPGLLFRKRESDEKWSVYLKGSHTSNLHNATIEFHECLNLADSFIDGTTLNRDKLRTKSIALINKVAQDRLKPIAAMHEFMKVAIKVLDQKIKELDERVPKRAVLEIYLERAREVSYVMQQDEAYFDQLLSMKIMGDNQEQSLRKAVYTSRFKLIKDAQLIETQIAQRILAMNREINGSETTSLAKINADFRFHLLHKSKGTLQRSLQRFLGTSHEQLDLNYDLRNKIQKKQKREKYYQEHKGKFDTLFRDLRSLFYNMHRVEALSWSEGIRTIRKTRGWTQKITALYHRILYPSIPMSTSTYGRLERTAQPDTKNNYATPESQRKKPVSPSIAQTLSKVFRVDPGLLLAHLSGSLY